MYFDVYQHDEFIILIGSFSHQNRNSCFSMTPGWDTYKIDYGFWLAHSVSTFFDDDKSLEKETRQEGTYTNHFGHAI